jgi:uncharacterized protein YbjT (DUF2867 family)
MSKLLTVFGATGQQGGSAVDYVLNDPDLSKEYRVRACTRNPDGAGGLALQRKGAEVVMVDVDDTESIKNAVQGADAVFAVTVSSRLNYPVTSVRMTDIAHSL